MKKKLLAIVAVMAMVVTMIPSMVFADVAALPAADSNGVIELTEDVTLEDTFTVGDGENITIKLNGHNISMVSNSVLKMISNKGTLTIEGNGIVEFEYTGDSYGTSKSVSTISNEQGTLRIEGGTFINSTNVSGQKATYVIDNLTNGNNGDSIVEIIDGSFDSGVNATAIRGFANSTVNINKITISNGKFKGAVQLQDPNNGKNLGELKISDGEFTATKDDTYTVYLYGLGDASGMNVTIEDGIFNGIVYLTQVNTTNPFEAEISGGAFNDSVWSCTWKDSITTNIPTITGGSFPYDVSAYLEEGAVVLVHTDDDDNTLYGVYNSEAEAIAAGAEYKVGNLYYSEYDMALAAAEENEENMTALARYIDFILLSPDVKEGDIIPLEQWYQTRITEETSLQDALDIILEDGMEIPEYEGYTLVWSLADWDWDEANEVDIFNKYTDIVSLDTKVDIEDGSNYSVFAKWVPVVEEGEGEVIEGAEGRFALEEPETAVEPSEEPEEATDTGDSMNMALPIMIAGLALAAMAAVVATRKRQN